MHVSRLRLAFLIAAVVVGAWLGYTARASDSAGGLGFMSSLASFVLAGLVLFVLTVFCVVSAFQPDGRGGQVARATVLAGVVFTTSFGGGWVAVTVVRGPDPVQLGAAGTVTLTIGDLPGFTRHVDATATCRSPFGSETVLEVVADAAGSVGADPTYFSLSMLPEHYPGIQPAIVVSLQPTLGEFAPQWSGGASELAEGVIGGPSGRVTFSGVSLGGNASGGVPPGWPLELSGEIVWSCGEWAR